MLAKGWVLGEVRANDIFSLRRDERPPVITVIQVSRGDLVILKLRSADVTHGFSLKTYGIYVAKGIQPGGLRLLTNIQWTGRRDYKTGKGVY